MTAHRRDELRPGGPYFDDLYVGLKVAWAPAVTLTSGHASAHQCIVGDRFALALDERLGMSVTGARAAVAHPALVWDQVIGQSTVLTQRVKANLFYRGLAFYRTAAIGDTLHTETEVVGLRENRQRPGRHPTGMAALRIRTVDQQQRPVLDFTRCAMLPLSRGCTATGHDDDLDALVSPVDPLVAANALIREWNFAPAQGATCAQSARLRAGMAFHEVAGDVVSSAPELARLTLNVATVHHDATAAGTRLVYGGHTIGLAAAQVARQLPCLLTIAAWYSCDHLGPVYEGDTLFSRSEVERVAPLESGGGLVCLRTKVRSVRADGSQSDVLDWRYVGVVA